MIQTSEKVDVTTASGVEHRALEHGVVESSDGQALRDNCGEGKRFSTTVTLLLCHIVNNMDTCT